MNIITFLTQKGGTAKTTSTANIGTALTRQGYSVLFVDLDQQGDLTDVLAPSAPDHGTMLDALQGRADLESVIVPTPYGDIVRPDPELNEYIPEPQELAQVLRQVAGKYDYIVIDNPPQLTAWTAASICAADYIVIPTIADTFGIKAARKMLNTVKTVNAETGHNGRIAGVLITLYDGRTVLARQARTVLQEIARQAGTEIFSTPIRQYTAMKEFVAADTDLYTYDPQSNAAADYRAVTAELLERIHMEKTPKKATKKAPKRATKKQ